MQDTEIKLENPLEQRLGYQMRRASGLMMVNLAERLAGIALRPTEAAILVLLRANPGITQTKIGGALAIQRANMVPLIAGLMTRKLIARQAADGRSHALSLTPTGRTLAVKAEALMLEHEKYFFGELSGAEREHLLQQLRGVRAVPSD